jgi:hypothetical protein
MKWKKKYHNVGTVPKCNRQIVETEPIPLPDIYITAHFSGLAQALQYKVAGLN